MIASRQTGYFKPKSIFWGILFLLLIPGQGAASIREKIPVAVTILPQAYFMERLGGNYVNVKVMIPSGASPETYEPTPRQLISISGVRLYVKLGQEGFPAEGKYLKALKKNAANISVISFADNTVRLKDDPHVWLSPSAVKELSNKISKSLIQIDPARKPYYENNLSIFLKDIEKMEHRIKTILARMEGKVFLVYHPAWGHFAAEFGLTQLAVEKEGKPVSALDLRKVIETAKSKRINVIFVQKGFDTRSARSVAHEINGTIIEVDPLEKDWLNNLLNFAEMLRKSAK